MAGDVREPTLGNTRRATCPVCGWKMLRADIRHRYLTCPSCKQGLKVQVPSSLRLISIGIGVAALSITYSLGVGGYGFLLVALIAYFLMSLVVGAVGSWFFLRLERDPGVDNDEILHITPRPGSSRGPE
jgi:hypothetical protein